MGLLSRLRVKEDFATLAAVSALRGVRDNLRGVVWQPFALSLGVPMSSLGGLESVMDFSRTLVQPILGGASDAYGRKRFLLVREFLVLAAGVLLLSRSWLLFPAVVLIGLSWALQPVWNSTVAESSEPSRLGYVYSILGTSYMAAALLGTLSAGLIAELYGFPSVYLVATGFALLSLMLVWLRLPETKPRGEGSDFNLSHAARSLLGALNPPPHLRGFYIAMTVDLVAFGMGYRLLNGMLTESYGYTPYMLGLMAAVNTGTMAAAQMPLGRVVDRVGYARFMALSQSLACVMLGSVVLSKRFEVVLAAQVLIGVSAALWSPAEQAWIARNVDPEERARSIGGYFTFRVLFSLLAPYIGGLLYEAFGFDTPIIVNVAIALVDVALILGLVRGNPPEQS